MYIVESFCETLRKRHDCTINRRRVYLQACVKIRSSLLSLHMCKQFGCLKLTHMLRDINGIDTIKRFQ